MSKQQNKPFNDFKTKGTVYQFIRFAEVARVDYFRQTVDIKYLDAENYVPDVYFSNSNFIGGFGGGMPEIGSFAIVFYYRLAPDKGFPIVLGFVPRTLFFSYEFEPEFAKPNLDNPGQYTDLRIRNKSWKLYPGDFLFSSTDGADLRLDDSVFMQDSAMDEILIDPFNQSISMLAYNQVLNSKAGKLNFGFANRSELINSELRSQFESATQFLSDGREIFTVNDSPKADGSPYGIHKLTDPGIHGYTEFRLDMHEYAGVGLDMPAENTHGVEIRDLVKGSGSDEDPVVNKPLITFTIGTLIGNDSKSKEGKAKYGKILYPSTFSDSRARIPGTIVAEDVVVENQNGVDAEKKVAAAFQVKLPNTKTSFNFTKEGVLEFSLDQSSAVHPSGAGRSANIGMVGSLKMQIGKQAEDNNSLLLDLLGGAQIVIGQESTKQRSLDLIMSNGLNLEINGCDTDRLSIRARIKNTVDIIISGNRQIDIDADDLLVVKGKMDHDIHGKFSQKIGANHDKAVGQSYTERIVQTYQSTIGLGRSTTIASNNFLNGDDFADKLKIIKGDKELHMLLGDYTEEMLLGDHEESIKIGDKTTKIGVGNFSLDVKEGDITAKTLAGDISVSATTGKIDFFALSTITATANQKISLESPLVKVGSAAQGGIVNDGPSGHLDYIVGILLRASKSVTCNSI